MATWMPIVVAVVLASQAFSVFALPVLRPLSSSRAAIDAAPVMYAPWVTEHHDTQNSGRNTVISGEFNGTCSLLAMRAMQSSFLSSTGVTSTDGRMLYVAE